MVGDYKKDEITSKKKNSTVTTLHSELNPVNIDDIRNKAFGTLEDEIDTNLINNIQKIIVAINFFSGSLPQTSGSGR